MARLAAYERSFDNRPLHAMMSGIAAGLADADLELPGPDLVVLWNRPDEGLSEDTLRRTLPVFGSQHAVALLAEGAVPYPASAAGNCDSFHQAFGTDDLHCGPPSIRSQGESAKFRHLKLYLNRAKIGHPQLLRHHGQTLMDRSDS